MKGFGIVLRNVNTPNISVQSRTIEPSKMFSRSKNNDLISDRINKIKATLFHPDYPVNPVRNYFNSNSTVADTFAFASTCLSSALYRSCHSFTVYFPSGRFVMEKLPSLLTLAKYGF